MPKVYFDGEHLAELRKDNGLTQKELAEKLNITREMLSKYERGQHAPSDKVKIAIAKFFSISLNYLMGSTKVEANYERENEITFPHYFPDSLVPEAQKLIHMLYDNYKHQNP